MASEGVSGRERPQENDRSGSSDNEKGEEAPPTPVGFFHPGLDHVRREVFWKWSLTTVVLMTFILAVLSICERF